MDIILGTFGPGSILGLEEFYNNTQEKPRIVSAFAQHDSTLLVISFQDFRNFFEDANEKFRLAFEVLVTERIKFLNTRGSDIYEDTIDNVGQKVY